MNEISWITALRSLFRRQRVEKEMDEELKFHLECQIQDNVRNGMSAAEARRDALLSFGGVEQIREDCRDARGFRFFDEMRQDLRYAFRGFRRSPGFALTVIGTLALGLGALAASFSIFNAMVLRPYAVRDPYSLYAFMGWGQRSYVGNSWKDKPFNWQEFRDFRQDNPAFSEVLGYQYGTARVQDKGASIQAVTGNYFTMLGGRACMGRTLLEKDDASEEGVAVASYAAWKGRLGADPAIVGKTVRLGERTMEIVGVACPEFYAPQIARVDFWVSLALSRELEDISSNFNFALSGPILDQPPDQFPHLNIMGRLKPGMTKESAEAALLAYGRQTYLTWRNWQRPESARIQPQASSVPLNRDTMRIFIPMFLAFGLVLLIACANVSNIMLARGLARRREIGIRISLGAGRARVVRQLFIESLLLAITASLAAFAVSYAIIRSSYWLLMHILPSAGLQDLIMAYINLPSFLPDLRVMAFLIAASLITTLLFGLMPAIQATRSGLVQATRGEFEAGHRSMRFRSALVITQATLCALLLILSGVAMHNEMRIASLDLGSDARGVFAISTSEKYRPLVLERLSMHPGVESIGACIKPPLDLDFRNLFHPRYYGQNKNSEISVMAFPVSPEYFDVCKIAVRGRKSPVKLIDITRSMDWDGMEVVASETAARRLFPAGDALGRILESKFVDDRSGKTIIYHFPIVGIARDMVGEIYDSAGSFKPNRAVVYWLQPPVQKNTSLDGIIVRMRGNPDSARRILQTELEQTIPGGMRFQLAAEWDELDRILYPYRALTGITGFLGALAFLLTVSGTFGVLSYVVAQRRREFGIRIALGAGKARVTGMVLRQSLRLAAPGAALGAAIALVIARMLARSVYRFDLLDSGGFAIGILIVIAAALVASWIPAKRAVNLDPARTLHCD